MTAFSPAYRWELNQSYYGGKVQEVEPSGIDRDSLIGLDGLLIHQATFTTSPSSSYSCIRQSFMDGTIKVRRNENSIARRRRW